LVDVTWLPFELHPEVPREGMARERLLPPDYIARARRNMDAMAREVGLVMRPKDRLINTRLALATAEFARERDGFEPVHRALFKAHWEGMADLDRIADLRRIVAEHDLDPDELEDALASGRYELIIDQHRAEASSVGIDAIPSHIVGGRYLLVGAQPISVFRQVLERIGMEGSDPQDRSSAAPE
jgi:predicted DsbA family dithiol-disulfide isomerase